MDWQFRLGAMGDFRAPTGSHETIDEQARSLVRLPFVTDDALKWLAMSWLRQERRV